MPPAASAKRIFQRKRELLATWIDQGAARQNRGRTFHRCGPQPYPPAVVDNFPGRELAARSLRPVCKAPRCKLVQRRRPDLTGLPPICEGIESLACDREPQAYAHLVDRCRAPLQRADAVHWLDLVRYADPSGHRIHMDINVSPGAVTSFAPAVSKPSDALRREPCARAPLPAPRQLAAGGCNRLSRTSSQGDAQAREASARAALKMILWPRTQKI